jgi:hypothetical protein
MPLCRQAGRVDSAVNAGYHIGIVRDHGARAGAANERGWTIDGEENAMLHPGARGLMGTLVVQPLVVSEMLGHAPVAFTLATYGHVQAEMRKPARDAMER